MSGAVEAIRRQREQFGRIGAGEFDLIVLPDSCDAAAIDDPAGFVGNFRGVRRTV